MERLDARHKLELEILMSDYFSGDERLETFKATGALMRMGDFSQLNIPDFIVIRNFIAKNKWKEAHQYLNFFYSQNTGMISFLVESVHSMTKLYAQLTGAENEISLRKQAISDYQNLINIIGQNYIELDDKNVLVQARNYFSEENLHSQTAAGFLSELEKTFHKLSEALDSKEKELALTKLKTYHQQALIYHDALIAFTYSYPTTVMSVSGEKVAIEVCNGSIMKNPLWNGMWELTKVLTPVDLAAFLADHLRFHFSGKNREGQIGVVEDDKKIRLIFDPCGSGGALRRNLKDKIVNLEERHQLGWNKCGEVNLYCSHCALNEKKSIDMFGYPKLVVEFEADPTKPCGWTIYKNESDVPSEVYTRLGIKK